MNYPPHSSWLGFGHLFYAFADFEVWFIHHGEPIDFAAGFREAEEAGLLGPVPVFRECDESGISPGFHHKDIIRLYDTHVRGRTLSSETFVCENYTLTVVRGE